MKRTFGMKRRYGRKRHLSLFGRHVPRRRPTRQRRPILARPAPFELADPLGWVIPPGSVHEVELAANLCRAMEQARWRAGTGVPTVPTRYVITMHPADRAWINAFAPERLSGALTRHAEDAGLLLVGDIDVELRAEPGTPAGHPRYWAGFSDSDLLILADPSAAIDAFQRA